MNPGNSIRHVAFRDSTLRDGEQTPGVAFSREQRLRIARALDDLGIDEIEIGFAASGPVHRQDMAAVTKLGLRARLLSLARPSKEDIDAALEVGVSGIILFIGVSDIHLRAKLRMPYVAALEKTIGAVGYARSAGLQVQVSMEDATRTEDDLIRHFSQKVVEAGAQRIGIADTVGVATPALMKTKVRAALEAGVPVAVHCHDDYGLAVANSLAGVEAGAGMVSSTILGIGERSGNAATEECAVALERLYGYRTSCELSRLTEVARLVTECAGVPVSPNKAIVGRNSFRHCSGIHVAALLRDPLCYEPFDPALVGAKREIVLGKTMGRAAIRHLAGAAADKLDDATCRVLLDRIKELAERGECERPGLLQELLSQCTG